MYGRYPCATFAVIHRFLYNLLSHRNVQRIHNVPNVDVYDVYDVYAMCLILYFVRIQLFVFGYVVCAPAISKDGDRSTKSKRFTRWDSTNMKRSNCSKYIHAILHAAVQNVTSCINMSLWFIFVHVNWDAQAHCHCSFGFRIECWAWRAHNRFLVSNRKSADRKLERIKCYVWKFVRNLYKMKFVDLLLFRIMLAHLNYLLVLLYDESVCEIVLVCVEYEKPTPNRTQW